MFYLEYKCLILIIYMAAQMFQYAYELNSHIWIIIQGTKIFQYCTCPAGRVTYNFHSSCKHMHSSLKIVCNKENGGGGVFDVFEVPYITAKMIFIHCSQFHSCIPYTDKKSFTFNTQVATFFSQKCVYFPLFVCQTF